MLTNDAVVEAAVRKAAGQPEGLRCCRLRGPIERNSSCDKNQRTSADKKQKKFVHKRGVEKQSWPEAKGVCVVNTQRSRRRGFIRSLKVTPSFSNSNCRASSKVKNAEMTFIPMKHKRIDDQQRLQ